MIISRTPFRISFFGGGTDYPAWFKENGGAVLATTIDKYCYLTCRYLPPFFEHRSRIVWSQIERVQEVAQIKHPAVREILTFLGIDEGVEIHHDGDLPARAGLGSSSSFVVGLLNALYNLKGIAPTKEQLVLDAILIERDQLQESVGSQDQVSVSFGGFNRIEFGSDGAFEVSPIIMAQERLQMLQDHLLLVYTGIARNASEVAGEQIRLTGQRKNELREMYQMVGEATNILCSDSDLVKFGELLHDSWGIKRSLTRQVSTPEIDRIYQAARDAGATGGKLLGAGGGGFMLFFVKPEKRQAVESSLHNLLQVPFRFEPTGSRIILFEPSESTPAGSGLCL